MMRSLLTATLLLLVSVTPTAAQIIRGTQFVFGSAALTASRRVLTGAGSPEGVVTAPVGTVYLQTDSAAGVVAAWSKQSGAGNTGWGRVAATTDTLAQFAATTSAQLAALLSNETGTGLAVFNTSPTFITPVLGTATGTTLALGGVDIITASRIFTGASNVSFGGPNNTNTAWIFQGALTDDQGIGNEFVLTVNVGEPGLGFYSNPGFVEAGSGIHSIFAGIYMGTPIITAGAATVTNTANLYIAGEMVATVTGANKALWVDNGRSDLDGTVFMPGISAGAAGDTDLCLNATTNELTDTGANTCIVSSLRYKSNWQPLPLGQLDKVLRLTPGSFHYTNDTRQIARIGLTAENMQAVEPRLTFYEPDGVTPRGVSYEETVALLTAAIQELAARMAALEAK